MLFGLINAMEGPLLSSQQFAFIFPVGLVIVFAVLVFAFGFKSSVEPPSFKYISSAADDRKNTKKKKTKDKVCIIYHYLSPAFGFAKLNMVTLG